jgi:hypothetical protein
VKVGRTNEHADNRIGRDQTSDVTILGKYVDALGVSVRGESRESIIDDLAYLKEISRSYPHEPHPMVGPLPGVPGGALELKPYNHGKYPLVMENDSVYVGLTEAPSLPKARIQFRSRALYEHDLGTLETIVDRMASAFLEPGFGVLVRRFDLAVDLQCEGWTMPEMGDVISRARKRTVEYDGTTVTGMTLGKKGKGATLQAQIYDKGREIEASGKGWMKGVWSLNEAYREDLPVVRIEFRFFRDVLRELKLVEPTTGARRGIDTIADLASSMGDLACHVVGGEGKRPWLRVASEGTRGKPQDRRPAAPWWRRLSEALLEGMPETGRVRLPGGPSADFERAAKMWGAYTIKLAVLAGSEGLCDVHDLEDIQGWAAREIFPQVLEAKGFDSFEQAVAAEEAKLGKVGAASSARISTSPLSP